MNHETSERDVLGRLYWLTFIESVGTVLLERGLYFYTENVLAFSDAKNLWLALAFGVTYVVGAISSHRVCLRVSERGAKPNDQRQPCVDPGGSHGSPVLHDLPSASKAGGTGATVVAGTAWLIDACCRSGTPWQASAHGGGHFRGPTALARHLLNPGGLEVS